MALSPKSWVPIVMVGPSGMSPAVSAVCPASVSVDASSSSPESSPHAPANRAKQANTAHSHRIFLVMMLLFSLVVRCCELGGGRHAGRFVHDVEGPGVLPFPLVVDGPGRQLLLDDAEREFYQERH